MKEQIIINNLSVNLEEITDMELETISGGIAAGDGGCVVITKTPPFPVPLPCPIPSPFPLPFPLTSPKF